LQYLTFNIFAVATTVTIYSDKHFITLIVRACNLFWNCS